MCVGVQRCNDTTAGLGYLEVKVICPCKSPHWAVDSLVSALSIPMHVENGSNPLLTLTLTTITSMQTQNKQASTPLHVHSTMQPLSKITVYRMYSCQYQPVKIKNQKEWHRPPNIMCVGGDGGMPYSPTPSY